MKAKDVSATAYGLLDCPPRYVMENILGVGRDERALERGRTYHAAFSAINMLLKKGIPAGPEEIHSLVMALGAPTDQSADLEEFLIWWAERMQGNSFVAVEEDGGRWQMTLGGVRHVGKFDAVYVTSEGKTVVPELKSGWIPDKADAWGLIQNKLYAIAAMETFSLSEVIIMPVSGRKFSYLLEYHAADIARLRPYIERDSGKVRQLLDLIEKAGDPVGVEKLLKRPEFAPTLNEWCYRCGGKGRCQLYGHLVFQPIVEVVPTGMTRLEAMEVLKRNRALLDKEWAARSKDLKADAAEAPVVEGNLMARVKVVEKEIKPSPGGRRTERHLVIEQVGGSE